MDLGAYAVHQVLRPQECPQLSHVVSNVAPSEVWTKLSKVNKPILDPAIYCKQLRWSSFKASACRDRLINILLPCLLRASQQIPVTCHLPGFGMSKRGCNVPLGERVSCLRSAASRSFHPLAPPLARSKRPR